MSKEMALYQKIKVKKVKELLEERRLLPWLSVALLNWGVIILTTYLAVYWDHPVLYIVAIGILGTRQHALQLLGHDGGHYLVCKSRKLNDLLTVLLAFWPIFISLKAYRKFHFSHHNHLGTPKDPELEFKKMIATEFSLPQRKQSALKQFAKNILGLNALEMFKTTALVFPGRYKLAKMLMIVAMVFGLFILIGLWKAYLLWIISFSTSYLAIHKYRTWIEHVGTTSTHRIKAKLWQRLIYLPINTWCHYEHHLWASVPFWKLPLVRKLVVDEKVITVDDVWEMYKNAPEIPSGKSVLEIDDLEGTSLV